MKLIVNVLVFLVFFQPIWAQSLLDSTTKDTLIITPSARIGPGDPFYFGNFAYPVKPDPQVTYDLKSRMRYSAQYSPDWGTNNQLSIASNPAEALIEMTIYSGLYLLDKNLLKKRGPEVIYPK